MPFLWSSGFFTGVGRMIAHLFLHAEPAVYSISPTVIEYWFPDSIDGTTIKDIPDLRNDPSTKCGGKRYSED